MSIVSVNQTVSVTLQYNALNHISMPTTIIWKGRGYIINKLGYHHAVRRGRTLIHIFSVANETMFFRLAFNSETLEWKLEEIFMP